MSRNYRKVIHFFVVSAIKTWLVAGKNNFTHLWIATYYKFRRALTSSKTKNQLTFLQVPRVVWHEIRFFIFIFCVETSWDIELKFDISNKLPWVYLSENSELLVTLVSSRINYSNFEKSKFCLYGFIFFYSDGWRDWSKIWCAHSHTNRLCPRKFLIFDSDFEISQHVLYCNNFFSLFYTFSLPANLLNRPLSSMQS